MNVLSLFDGIACGLVALKRAGIKVTHYCASEIDEKAIAIAKKNHPEIIHVGDINNLDFSDYKNIDLIIGGSPCQGFSVSGKQEGFNDKRSQLFFKFVEAVKVIKPKWFLLENVRMKKDYRDAITWYLGVEPICINSALVSAQNRIRYYWTTIPNVSQPDDRNINLKDIIEDGLTDRDKSYCLDANYYKGGNLKSYFEKHRRQLVFMGLANDIKTIDQRKRVYHVAGKSPTLMTSGGYIEPKIAIDLNHYRKLTPLECERLQTLPDGYTEGVSDWQRYKMLGNGWTVDVIAHLFKGLKND